jgi:hypothetical protein
MNSDGDQLYTKVVAFDEIYNFVVQNFFIWSHLMHASRKYSARQQDLAALAIDRLFRK